MSSLPNFLLHGVQYELSTIFQRNGGKLVELPVDFDIKDPEVLLEECNYDFSVEKKFLSSTSSYSLKNKQNVSRVAELPSIMKQKHLKKQPKESPPVPKSRSKTPSKTATETKQKENYQDLKDALDYVSKEKHHRDKEKKSKGHSSKSHKHQSGVDKYDRHDKDVGVPDNKSNLLDKFADLLTDDVKFTENP